MTPTVPLSTHTTPYKFYSPDLLLILGGCCIDANVLFGRPQDCADHLLVILNLFSCLASASPYVGTRGIPPPLFQQPSS